MTPTARLLDFAEAEHRLDGVARDHAARLLADTLITGCAGKASRAAADVLAAAREWGGDGECRILGEAVRTTAASAAFANGFRIHCLEWDAVHEAAVVHAMSVVTAALLAAIDRRGGADPESALAALAVGVDIASGLGIAATSPLRFFRPATAGCIGAAIAVARLEGVRPMGDVLGLAYSQCAGTMQAHTEGSVALPLQIAFAARAAISAVDLVRQGLAGPHDALEGPFGYFRLFDEGALETYTQNLGERWLIAEVSTKPYASGRASHGVLSALASVLGDGIAADAVVRIEAWVPPLVMRLVGRPPVAGMAPAYARLCLAGLVAMMLEDGRIDPRRFDDPGAFGSAAFAARAAMLVLHEDSNDDPNALSPQRVSITLADGTRIERTIPAALGHPDLPMTARDTEAKRALARELAGTIDDERPFTDPLGYFTCPEQS